MCDQIWRFSSGDTSSYSVIKTITEKRYLHDDCFSEYQNNFFGIRQ